jgi:hypothetical protein
MDGVQLQFPSISPHKDIIIHKSMDGQCILNASIDLWMDSREWRWLCFVNLRSLTNPKLGWIPQYSTNSELNSVVLYRNEMKRVEPKSSSQTWTEEDMGMGQFLDKFDCIYI